MLLTFVYQFSPVAGFPVGSEVKVSAWNVGDLGSIPGSGRSPGEGNGNPTPVLLPRESHGGRSLVGYSPWGCKESDMTEQLSLTHSLSPVADGITKRLNEPISESMIIK